MMFCKKWWWCRDCPMRPLEDSMKIMFSQVQGSFPFNVPTTLTFTQERYVECHFRDVRYPQSISCLIKFNVVYVFLKGTMLISYDILGCRSFRKSTPKKHKDLCNVLVRRSQMLIASASTTTYPSFWTVEWFTKTIQQIYSVDLWLNLEMNTSVVTRISPAIRKSHNFQVSVFLRVTVYYPLYFWYIQELSHHNARAGGSFKSQTFCFGDPH